MIVTAGAAEGQPEEDERGIFGLVVEDLLPPLFEVGGVVLVGPEAIEAGSDQRLGVVRFQFVAGELLPNEPVVRQVGVERADDVIAIFVGIRPVVVGLEAIGLGVPNEIEPVLRPAFAVTRRG